MHVVTWNVYMAPTMPGRRARRRGVQEALLRFAERGADVVCLQEVSDVDRGPLARLLAAAWPKGLRWVVPERAWDALVVAESALLVRLLGPRRAARFCVRTKRAAALAAWAAEHTPFAHAASAAAAGAVLSPGLLTLARTPVRPVAARALPGHAGHFPGVLVAEVEDRATGEAVRVLNAHVAPTLAGSSDCLYRLVHLGNWLGGWDAEAVALGNFEALAELLRGAPGARSVLAGDLNAGEGQVDQVWARANDALAGLGSFCLLPAGRETCSTHPGSVQIDHIFTRDACASVEAWPYWGSDHRPLSALLQPQR